MVTARAPSPAIAPLALTMGEPAGIGGEITLKAWAARTAATPAFFIIDDAARLEAIAKQFNIACPIARIGAAEEARGAFDRALPVLALEKPLTHKVTLGAPTAATAKAVIGSIDQAVALVKAGRASG